MNTDETELSDLKLFHDPFSEAEFRTVKTGGWNAKFERQGVPVSIRKDADGRILSNSSGKVIAGNFRALLAGEHFANLDYLARALAHEYKEALPNWMEVPFTINQRENGTSSFDEVVDFITNLSGGGVVGLEGPAGAGKTHFIERFAALRAHKFLNRDGAAPILIPVTSAGKVLSAVDDRIDGAFSALRASFNRSEMPVLMRYGLISLAIDGFDELSDSRGYDNSWSALRDMFQDVGGSGLVLLSGRDSFISAQELQELIGPSITMLGSDLHSIRIDFPGVKEASDWVAKKRPVWEEQKGELEARFDEYYWLRRPFFVSQIAEMTPKKFLESGDEPIVALCDSIVEREVDKLGLPNGVSTNEGKALVYSILTEAARTMMDYEVGYVDSSLLELAVEIACEEILPYSEQLSDALSARAKTLTLLEPAHGSGKRDNRMFAHEKIKAFFYSRHLIDELTRDGPLPTGLRRNQLTLSDLTIFSALITGSSDVPIAQFLTNIREKLRDENKGSLLASNLAALEISCPCPAEIDPGIMTNISIIDAATPDQAAITFRDVYINRFDVSDSDLSSCEFRSCEIGELIISKATRFGKTRPKAFKLVGKAFDGTETRVHGEEAIEEELSKLSLSETTKTVRVLPKTVDILVRLMLKGHWVRLEQDDHRGKRLVERQDWPDISKLLTKHGVLETRNIGAGGGRGEFVHLKSAQDFLTGQSESREVQQALQALSKLQ